MTYAHLSRAALVQVLGGLLVTHHGSNHPGAHLQLVTDVLIGPVGRVTAPFGILHVTEHRLVAVYELVFGDEGTDPVVARIRALSAAIASAQPQEIEPPALGLAMPETAAPRLLVTLDPLLHVLTYPV